VSDDRYGLSIDADVALWLEKRRLDGEVELEETGTGSFVLVTSALHTEFDYFKSQFKQYTKRGFSMLHAPTEGPTELPHPSSPVILFKTYLHLECS
jgi:hypothetical protein